MAGKLRHWKEKNGRFYARIAIPAPLRPVFDGKSELLEPLGGDRKIAQRNHAAAVAHLQQKIEDARGVIAQQQGNQIAKRPCRPVTTADHERAIWEHYMKVLAADEAKRMSFPSPEEIAIEYERLMQRIEAGEADPTHGVSAVFNTAADYELKAGARHFDRQRRERHLNGLRHALANGDTTPVDATTEGFVREYGLDLSPASDAWRALALKLLRAEIEAVQRTLERDEGLFDGRPADPIIKPPTEPKQEAPLPLLDLFQRYIDARQAIGAHPDGGIRWTHVFKTLITQLGHDDARKISKRDLLDWRDQLLKQGLSPKTIADSYLAAVRAVMKWAFENDLLPSNVAEAVRQPVPKVIRAREVGYTEAEALAIITATTRYEPWQNEKGFVRESPQLTAAKRWVPMLCAFTGARVTEMTQLRKEDLFRQNNMWAIRITPNAGSVKTNQYRDVPLHRQVLALGFADFVTSAKPGPLFHTGERPEQYLTRARISGERLSEWLHSQALVPEGIQPNHAWRHRLKTVARELGISDRVIDAIQGHAARTAGDSYGDVTLKAKHAAIEKLPGFALG